MSDSRPALFRRWPHLEHSLPWASLGRRPTEVHPLQLGSLEEAGRAWVKRDDRTGDLYGGNKVRKLELILAAAREDGVRRLITAGAAGSHHVLATTVYGRSLGFEVTAVLFPQKRTPHVRDVLLRVHALGAELRFAHRMEAVPAAVLGARWAHRGERTRVVPPGGSDPLGTLGYVSAGLELVEQIEQGALPVPATVHVAGGTLGTAAGLGLGFTLGGVSTRVAAYRITSAIVCNRRVLEKLVRGAARLLERRGVAPTEWAHAAARVELRPERLGPGYGRATPEGEAATRRFAAAGLQLDPTYTAKAAAGYLEALAEGGPDGRHLFWHTLSAVQPEVPRLAEPEELPAAFRDYLLRP